MHTTTVKTSHWGSKSPKLRGLGKICSHPTAMKSSSVSGALRWVWLITTLQSDREAWGWGTKNKEGAHSSGGKVYQGLSPVLTLNSFGSRLQQNPPTLFGLVLIPPAPKRNFTQNQVIWKVWMQAVFAIALQAKKCSLEIIFNTKNVDSEFQQNSNLSGMVMKWWTSLYQIIWIKQVDTEFFFFLHCCHVWWMISADAGFSVRFRRFTFVVIKGWSHLEALSVFTAHCFYTAVEKSSALTCKKITIAVIMIIITTITKQPGARRKVKWFMFSFGLHINNEHNKQEIGQLWCHMPCATERKTLWNLS